MPRLTLYRTEDVGRLRRAVALLAVTAWTLSAFICPMPDHRADVDQAHNEAAALGEHVHQHGQSPNHADTDLCCKLLSGNHAIVKDAVTPAVVKATAASFPVAIAVFADLTPAAAPTTRLIPLTNGPPRNLYQRFATFWSHAPPASHA